MQRLAVIGNPIEHSLSPWIHQQFAEQLNIEIAYQKVQLEEAQFEPWLTDFFTNGGKGCNITIPYKDHAFRWARKHSKRALYSGAVNTLISGQDDLVYGDNTDGIGLIRDLARSQISITGKKVLLLGAGGAAKGVLPALGQEKPESVHIGNRTEKTALRIAEDLAEAFGASHWSGSSLQQIPELPYDVIINASASSLANETLPLQQNILIQVGCAYDLAYDRTQETSFLQQCKAAGVGQCLDGRGMLIEQAAESFLQWFGQRPDTKLVHDSFAKHAAQ